MSLFVDTSAFYAAADSSDANHVRATSILAGGERLVATDHVVVESWILVDARLGRVAAQRFWDAIRSGAAEIATVGPADLDRAWRIAAEFPDQDYSIVDLTSFAVMERLSVPRVASFDRHFAIHRFGRHRDRAFQVVA